MENNNLFTRYLINFKKRVKYLPKFNLVVFVETHILRKRFELIELYYFDVQNPI